MYAWLVIRKKCQKRFFAFVANQLFSSINANSGQSVLALLLSKADAMQKQEKNAD
jgi:hypothetical protein